MTEELKKSSSFKKFLVPAAWIIVIAWWGWLVSYSLEQVKLADAEEEILVCDDQGECIKTTHIHADVTFDLCGKSTVLPRERGDLAWLHTHKEVNYLHFHDKLALDSKSDHAVAPQKGEAFDFDEYFDQPFDKRLSVQELIETYEIDPVEFCGTDDVSIAVEVNGQPSEQWVDYNWKDWDEIVLRYTAN